MTGTASTLIEVIKFLNYLMTSSEVCFAEFGLCISFVTVASFLFPLGVLLLTHYKFFPSPFVFLLDFYTSHLVLLFLLSSSGTENTKYFQTLDVIFACICIAVLLGICLKVVLLWCFHIWIETIFGNSHIVLLFWHTTYWAYVFHDILCFVCLLCQIWQFLSC